MNIIQCARDVNNEKYSNQLHGTRTNKLLLLIITRPVVRRFLIYGLQINGHPCVQLVCKITQI